MRDKHLKRVAVPFHFSAHPKNLRGRASMGPVEEGLNVALGQILLNYRRLFYRRSDRNKNLLSSKKKNSGGKGPGI